MKKGLSVILLSFLILNIFLISPINSATTPSIPEIGGSINPDTGIPSEIEKLMGIGENITDAERRKAYLSKEWDEILLKNKAIAAMDTGFTQISFLFFILFAKQYSLSLKLLVIIIIWIYFLFVVMKMFNGFSGFSGTTKFLSSLAIVIIMSHLQIFTQLTTFLNWLLFIKKEGWWAWMMVFIEIIVLFGFFYLMSYVSKIGEDKRKQFKEKEKKTKEEVREIELEAARKAATKAWGSKVEQMFRGE